MREVLGKAQSLNEMKKLCQDLKQRLLVRSMQVCLAIILNFNKRWQNVESSRLVETLDLTRSTTLWYADHICNRSSQNRCRAKSFRRPPVYYENC